MVFSMSFISFRFRISILREEEIKMGLIGNKNIGRGVNCFFLICVFNDELSIFEVRRDIIFFYLKWILIRKRIY